MFPCKNRWGEACEWLKKADNKISLCRAIDRSLSALSAGVRKDLTAVFTFTMTTSAVGRRAIAPLAHDHLHPKTFQIILQ